jgi:predicted ArsR family transcriptional regulator
MLPVADETRESPRDRIIRTLLRRGALTVTELTRDLGVTATAVREQVSRLTSEGWLNKSRRSSGPGRPAALFALSEKSKRLFTGHGPDLLRSLIREIAALDGEAKVQIILERVTRRMAEAARPAVGNGALAERVRGLEAFLSHEGVVAESDTQPQGQRLAVFTCPYSGVVEEHRELCELELAAFSELTASPVQRQHCLLDGHRACEFTFSQNDGAGHGIPGASGT